MLRWIPFPFVRFFFFFAAGIILGFYFPGFGKEAGILLGTGLIFYFFLILFFKKKAFSIGIAGLSCFLLLGYLLSLKYQPIEVNFSEIDAYSGVIQHIRERPERLNITFQVYQVKENGIWYNRTGKINIILNNTSLPEVGDHMLITGTPDPIMGPRNPGEFDYRKWQAEKGIFFQHFVGENDYKITQYNYAHPVIHISNRIRSQALLKLKSHIHDKDALGVIEALVLGYKNDLTSEIRNAYSGTGAMHVLAVSGLHVGMIYLAIGFCFGWLKRKRNGKVIYIGLALFILSFYAIITGLSPSVLRASLMFSFIIIGTSFNRNSNIYNSMAASAMVLLICNPLLIKSVSFQLSYLAVLGIVYFYPKLYNLFYFNSYLLDKIWALTSVSISAQLATFPIMIYYFQQLPAYGLISNLKWIEV